jgi:hypothetical protein
MHAGTYRVENSAQGSSCQLKFVHGLTNLGACIIKLITDLFYGFRNKIVFIPGKYFQPSLVFGDKHKLITVSVNYGRNKFYDTVL